MSVRTRFAPSPTGVLHLGSIRTALFCWLFARHHEGSFILRIEDTDRERSTEANVKAILEGLAWLGIDADEGPMLQSDRSARYRDVIETWLAEGKAYHCYCTSEELEALRATQLAGDGKVRYDGRCRHRRTPRDGVNPVVRFMNPEHGDVVVEDEVRGRVTFRNEQLDDLIIARSDGSPTYNFAVVVDDFDMGITHVIRGDDHLNNTPRQMNMFDALGAKPPVFAHVPMILGPDGAKLSKRHGAVDIRDYRDQGYLPEAMLNYLVRLGWSHGDQEVFSIAEMVGLFDLSALNHSASAFNPEKLQWLNQQHMMSMAPDELGRRLKPYVQAVGIDPATGPDLTKVAAGYRERAKTLLQMAEASRYCFEDFTEVDPQAAKKHLRPVLLEALLELRARLEQLGDWTETDIEAAIKATAEAHDMKLGKLGQPVRVAVTGGTISPPLDVTLALVGRERTLARLLNGAEIIRSRAGTQET